MEVKGKIKTILPVETGTSKSTGNEWKKITFAISNNEGYEGREQIFAFEIFGAEKVDNFNKYNKEGQEVIVKFNVQCNEWKGKYYTTLQAWRVESGEAVEQAYHTPTATPTAAPAPIDDIGDDPLPF